jgi:predicted DsbA family dithiol-disulfide isomerase
VASLAHQMAIEFEHVTGDVIEANEFPELSRRYGVSGVPKVVINDKVEFVGAVPEEHFVAAIQQAAGVEPTAAEPDEAG